MFRVTTFIFLGGYDYRGKKMLYRKLGNTGEEVSILGYGCMRLPVLCGAPDKIDGKRVIELLRYAIDSGINYFDSAYSYHGGMNEVFLGKALKDGYREKSGRNRRA